MSTLFAAAVTTGLAAATVALWTARVTLTARGRSGFASMLAAVEATVFVTVVARLMGDLDDPVQVLSYAFGVAAGTTFAVRLLRLIEPTVVKVDGVVPRGADRLLSALHANGWPTTTAVAHGLGGPVTTVSVTTTADRLPALYAIIDDSDTAAFWTESQVRSARTTVVPHGFVQTAVAGRLRPLAPRDAQSSNRDATAGTIRPPLRRSRARRGRRSTSPGCRVEPRRRAEESCAEAQMTVPAGCRLRSGRGGVCVP